MRRRALGMKLSIGMASCGMVLMTVVNGWTAEPATMLRTPDGKDLGVRLMAHTVTPVP